jgi:hypothetical protein
MKIVALLDKSGMKNRLDCGCGQVPARQTRANFTAVRFGTDGAATTPSLGLRRSAEKKLFP